MLLLSVGILLSAQGYSQCSPSNDFPCKTCSADFGLSWNASTMMFDVFMNSSVLYDDVKISTAQATIVIPTGYISNSSGLNILDNVGVWDANTLIIAPTEDPANDYLSIGLSQFNTLEDFIPNTPVLLFSFSFVGDCPPGNITLINNNSALGNTPNSTGSSLANEINIDETNSAFTFCDDYKQNYYGPELSCFVELEPEPEVEEPLPLELLSFTGQLMPTYEVELSWTTENEKEVDHFEVYHAIDGINFIPIGMKAGKGTGSGNNYYSLMHTRPIRGINYYKLKTIESTGEKSFSQIVEITIKNSLEGIVLFPNPTYDKITLQLPSFIGFSNQADLHVQVYDVLHHKLKEFIFNDVNSEMIDIDLSSLISGSYIIRVTHGTNVFNEIVVVEEKY